MGNSQFTSLTVLVVDDEVTMRLLLKGLLREIGFEKILEAEDGVDALEVLGEYPETSLIFLDLEMPFMNGLQFLARLRSHERVQFRSVPVVIVTGHSEQSTFFNAVDLGIHGFIAKPVSQHKLEIQIGRALQKRPINPGRMAKPKRFFKELDTYIAQKAAKEGSENK